MFIEPEQTASRARLTRMKSGILEAVESDPSASSAEKLAALLSITELVTMDMVRSDVASKVSKRRKQEPEKKETDV